MNKTLFATLFFTLFSLQLTAQKVEYTAFGMKGSLGASTLTGIDKYGDRIPGTPFISPGYSTQPYPAIGIGFVHQTMFYSGLLLQTEIEWGGYGVKVKNSDVESIFAFHLNITPHIGRKIYLKEGNHVVIGVGPFFGFDPLNWIEDNYSDYGRRENSPSIPGDGIIETSHCDFKKVNAGLSALIAYEIDYLQFSINYSHGLLNVSKDDHPIKSRVLQAGVTYFF